MWTSIGYNYFTFELINPRGGFLVATTILKSENVIEINWLSAQPGNQFVFQGVTVLVIPGFKRECRSVWKIDDMSKIRIYGLTGLVSIEPSEYYRAFVIKQVRGYRGPFNYHVTRNFWANFDPLPRVTKCHTGPTPPPVT